MEENTFNLCNQVKKSSLELNQALPTVMYCKYHYQLGINFTLAQYIGFWLPSIS